MVKCELPPMTAAQGPSRLVASCSPCALGDHVNVHICAGGRELQCDLRAMDLSLGYRSSWVVEVYGAGVPLLNSDHSFSAMRFDPLMLAYGVAILGLQAAEYHR